MRLILALSLALTTQSADRAKAQDLIGELEILKTPDGFENLKGMGINLHGSVVGLALGGPRAFVSERGVSVEILDPPNGWRGGRGNDIGQSGQIAVTAEQFSDFVAFRYTPGLGYEKIGTLSGDRSRAEAINRHGDVAGTNDSPQEAFLFTDDGIFGLGFLPGQRDSAASDINDNRQIVGFSGGNTPDRAFRWTPGEGMLDLGVPDGFRNSYALGINENGDSVGSLLDPNLSNETAFIHTDAEGIVALEKLAEGKPAHANAINDARWIVGTAQNAERVTNAVAWIPDFGIVDLNSLVESDVQLVEAFDINANGQITGFGTMNGDDVAFRLTVIPSPATVTLMSMSTLMAGRRRYTRHTSARNSAWRC